MAITNYSLPIFVHMLSLMVVVSVSGGYVYLPKPTPTIFEREKVLQRSLAFRALFIVNRDLNSSH